MPKPGKNSIFVPAEYRNAMIIIMPRHRLRAVMEENRKEREKKKEKDGKKGSGSEPGKEPPCIEELYPDAVIIDVTSKSADEFIRLSPFYPHGGIPVPFSPKWEASCVEAVWQGLKVFEKAGVDTALFRNRTMKNLKRNSNKKNKHKYGALLGHCKGVNGRSDRLLDYNDARMQIYVPTYLWMLKNKGKPQVDKIRRMSKKKDVVLLDYNTNPNIYDTRRPLSHAALIKAYIEGNYPKVRPLAEETVPEEVLSQFSIGLMVKHGRYGVGTITSIQGGLVIVDFKKGSKTINLAAGTLEPYTPPAAPVALPKRIEVHSGKEWAVLLVDAEGKIGVEGNPVKKVESISCEYEEIRFYPGKVVRKQQMPTYYFLVKKDGLWGLLNKTGRQQAPCIYDELRPLEKVGLLKGFTFRRGEVTGILNGKGEETLD